MVGPASLHRDSRKLVRRKSSRRTQEEQRYLSVWIDRAMGYLAMIIFFLKALQSLFKVLRYSRKLQEWLRLGAGDFKHTLKIAARKFGSMEQPILWALGPLHTSSPT